MLRVLRTRSALRRPGQSANAPLRALSARPDMPFKKIMAANRGEIATRIMRAGTELGKFE